MPRRFPALPTRVPPSGGPARDILTLRCIPIALPTFFLATVNSVDKRTRLRYFEPMLHGKKLGVLLSTRPDQPGFADGVNLAEAALTRGVSVFLYCIDEAVFGINDPRLQSLKARGLKLFACAYGAQRRSIPIDDSAIFAGLGVLSDLIADTDRFVSFN